MQKLSSQLLKGTLEGALLAVLVRHESYAYEIHEQLEERGFGKIAEGTIYPLLLKMERTGQIAGERRPSPDGGPARKYYHVTHAGKNELAAFIIQWGQLDDAMTSLLEDVKND